MCESPSKPIRSQTRVQCRSILQIVCPLLGIKVVYSPGQRSDHATYSISFKRVRLMSHAAFRSAVYFHIRRAAHNIARHSVQGQLSKITVCGLSVTKPWRLLLHWRLEVKMQSVEVSMKPKSQQRQGADALHAHWSSPGGARAGGLILLMLIW